MNDTRLEHGQGLIEYALILALVFLVVIIVLALFGDALVELYNNTLGPILDAFTP